MGLGSWILCSFLAVMPDGTKRNIMIPGQVNLEAGDGVHHYIDFSHSLHYNKIPMGINAPWIRMINYKRDCAMKYTRYKEEVNGLKTFPENDN